MINLHHLELSTMTLRSLSFVLFSAVLLLQVSCADSSGASEANTNRADDAGLVQIAREAYIYGYPLVMIEFTRRIGTSVDSLIPGGFAPTNQISHKREFPDHQFTAVVKPNCDTYYSSGFFDLKAEPLVLSVPATKRYYLLPLLDAWSNVFASPGTRTTGTGAGTFLLAGPFWKGETPKGMTLIQSPTNTVWMIGRTQVNSEEDGKKVVYAIQDGYKLVPLSAYGKPYTPPKGKANPEFAKIVPVEDARRLSLSEYFNMMSALMVDNPPAAADTAMVRKMAALGLEAGKPFSMEAFSPELRARLDSIPQQVMQGIAQNSDKGDPKQMVNGWKYMTEKVGDFGTDYTLRAAVAYGGLGANSPKDAVYPGTAVDAEGNAFQSDQQYVLHFDKTGIPPANAFWSLTMYNEKDFLAENTINRFAIGDRDKLKYNADGSLDIYLQRMSPGKTKESNWLPTPANGIFKLTMRIYWPKVEVLERKWLPPSIRKVNA
jgi:hypothetical protein